MLTFKVLGVAKWLYISVC